ncbi:TPA: iron-containing alcohol dehydrogenase [Candidatus Poribacteria bacterium]|nr:iron-containing alcohol dehydrogenase [Candidatus Poribacteria bacterium]
MYQNIHRFFTVPNIIWGSDSVRECLASEIKAIGIKKVALITDKTIVQVGIAGAVESYLRSGNIEYFIYDDAESEPAFDIIQTACDAVRSANIDALVALGGGSVIDLAKAVSVILANGGDPLDYAGVGKVSKAGPPLIAIPTTAGTGSEVTPNAIFVHKEKQTKMGIVSQHILPRVAIVDPQMTITVPPKITAATGMDALCHAIESYISIKASPLTDILSLQAIEYIGQNLRAAVKDGSNRD